MCLYEEAHGVDASHPIFRGPFPVELTWHEMATPDHYRKYPGGDELGPTMTAWRVCREPVAGYFGVVADGFGFEDSPDAEWISSGRNSKNPRAAALARQGNFFQWGFSASPKGMTDEARTVFLNTIAYMKQFDGCAPLAVGQGRSREWLPVFAHFVASGDGLDYYRLQLPEEWLAAATGKGGEMLEALVATELGYVRHDGKRWVVDADCKALGIANRDPRLLQRCVELLETEEDVERARTLLERYTGREHATAAEWRAWLDAAGDRQYFSDLGGFRWRLRPVGYPAPYRAANGGGGAR